MQGHEGERWGPTVYSDADNRILFLLEANDPNGIKIYFCHFH